MNLIDDTDVNYKKKNNGNNNCFNYFSTYDYNRLSSMDVLFTKSNVKSFY